MFSEIYGDSLFLFMFIILAVALFWIVTWIMTLVHQAHRKRWVWFVFSLIVPGITFIYWFVWMVAPEFRKTKRRR